MEEKRMKLNKNKTKVIVVSKNKNTNSLDFKIKRVQVKEIEEFTYLDSKITQDRGCKCEIRRRIYTG